MAIWFGDPGESGQEFANVLHKHNDNVCSLNVTYHTSEDSVSTSVGPHIYSFLSCPGKEFWVAICQHCHDTLLVHMDEIPGLS